jgi:predicted nucleic acid-binding protein
VTTDRRLVIDTNLWISRLLAPGGVAARAVDHGLAWGMPLVSEVTLAELAEVLSRPRFDRWVTRAERQQFLRQLGGVVRVVTITHARVPRPQGRHISRRRPHRRGAADRERGP